MQQSTITIQVGLDEKRVPTDIQWAASDAGEGQYQKAKAMMLSFWDGSDKAALRIDLWTQQMMVDEMADFYYQTLMTMADTYGRATQYADQVEQMKEFARNFLETFRAKQLATNKA
jgi:gliding motility-associated protein GldC